MSRIAARLLATLVPAYFAFILLYLPVFDRWFEYLPDPPWQIFGIVVLALASLAAVRNELLWRVGRRMILHWPSFLARRNLIAREIDSDSLPTDRRERDAIRLERLVREFLRDSPNSINSWSSRSEFLRRRQTDLSALTGMRVMTTLLVLSSVGVVVDGTCVWTPSFSVLFMPALIGLIVRAGLNESSVNKFVDYLAGDNGGRCRSCTYDLRGLPSIQAAGERAVRCPECGHLQRVQPPVQFESQGEEGRDSIVSVQA